MPYIHYCLYIKDWIKQSQISTVQNKLVPLKSQVHDQKEVIWQDYISVTPILGLWNIAF